MKNEIEILDIPIKHMFKIDKKILTDKMHEHDNDVMSQKMSHNERYHGAEDVTEDAMKDIMVSAKTVRNQNYC